MKVEKRIALKGQEYATPKTESVTVSNQGVLCASATRGSFGLVGSGSGTVTF